MVYPYTNQKVMNAIAVSFLNSDNQTSRKQQMLRTLLAGNTTIVSIAMALYCESHMNGLIFKFSVLIYYSLASSGDHSLSSTQREQKVHEVAGGIRLLYHNIML